MIELLIVKLADREGKKRAPRTAKEALPTADHGRRSGDDEEIEVKRGRDGQDGKTELGIGREGEEPLHGEPDMERPSAD